MKTLLFYLVIAFATLGLPYLVTAQTDTISYPGGPPSIAPGGYLRNFRFHPNKSISTEFRVGKENIIISNQDTSFYSSESGYYGFDHFVFSTLIPEHLDTGYYDISFHSDTIQSVCGKCLHVTYNTHPKIYLFYDDGALDVKKGELIRFQMVSDKLTFDTSITNCFSRIKILPQDIVLQKDKIILSNIGVYALSDNILQPVFEIPLNASPGLYNLKINGDFAACKVTIDSLKVLVYCDSISSPKPNFTDPEKVCLGQPFTISIDKQEGVEYFWSGDRVKVVNSNGNSATFQSNVDVEVRVNVERKNSCGQLSPIHYWYQYKILFGSASIYGAREVCANTTNRYMNPYRNDNDLVWSLKQNSGTIRSINNDTIDVTFSNISDTIIVRGRYECGIGSILGTFPVKINNLNPKPVILANDIIVPHECGDLSMCPTFTGYNLLSSIANAKSYQWYRNDILIPDATDSNYLFVNKTSQINELSGNYQVKVETECGINISDKRFISYTVQGLEESSNQSMQVELIPNPASDRILIKQNIGQGLDYKIYNSAGELLKQIIPSNNRHEQEIIVSDLKEGLYFLKIGFDQNTVTKKFLIVR